MPVISWLPLAAFVPVQPPEAVQVAPLVADQVKVEDPLYDTVVGLALKISDRGVVGGGVPPPDVGAGFTVTLTVLLTVPVAPWHARAKVALALSGPTVWLPEVDWAPDHEPLAAQLVTLAPAQVKVTDEPAVIVVELALNVRLGVPPLGGGGAEVAVRGTSAHTGMLV